MDERSRRRNTTTGERQTCRATGIVETTICTRRQVAAAARASEALDDACLWFALRFASTLLLVLLLAQAPLVSAWSTQYLYASGPLLADDDLAQSLGSAAWVRADRASLTDDHANDQMDLQFAFPFMHHRRTLAISPNGVLFFDLKRIGCCAPLPIGMIVSGPQQCVWVDTPCGCASLNIAYNYRDSIAPLLTDLDPTSSPGSLISYRSLPERFDVRWQNLRLAGQGSTPELNGQSFDFVVSLHVSGLVEFRYLRMIDMVLALATNPGSGDVMLKGARCFSVGLRDAGWGNRDATREARMAMLENRTVLDPHALIRRTYAAEIAAWGSPRPGFYPSLDLVRANSTLSFCPLATSFCLHPTSLPTTGEHAVQITAEQMECAVQGHAFFCRFSAPLSPTAAVGTDPASIDVAATFSAPSNSLSCVTPSLSTLRALNASANAALSTFQVRLVDRSASNIQQVVAMDSPLLLSFTPGAIATASSSASGLCSSCSDFLPLYCVRDCAGVFRGNASLDSCGVCAGGSTGIRPDKDVGCSGRCFERVYIADSDSDAMYTDFHGVNHTLAGDPADKECYCDRVYEMQLDDSTPVAAVSTTDDGSGSGSGILIGTTLAANAAQSTSLVMRKLRSDIDAVSPLPHAPAPSPPLTTPLPPPVQRAFVPSDPDFSASSSSYRSTVFHDNSLPSISWASGVLQASDISARAGAECSARFEFRFPMFYAIALESRYYRWFLLSEMIIFVGIWLLLRQMDKSWREDGAGDFSQRGRQVREQRSAESRSRANSAAAVEMQPTLRAMRSARTASASPAAAALARENGINEETEDRSTRELRDLKQQQLQVRSAASKTLASSSSSSSSSCASSSCGGSLGSSLASSPRPTIHLPPIAEAHPARLLPDPSSGNGSGVGATLILPTAVAAASHHHSPLDSGVDSSAASEIEAEGEGSGASSAAEGAAQPPPLPLAPLLASPTAAPTAVAVAASTPASPATVVAAVSSSSHVSSSQSTRPLRPRGGGGGGGSERDLASSSGSERTAGRSTAASPTASPHAPAIGSTSTKQAKLKTKAKTKQKAFSTASTDAAGELTADSARSHRDSKHKHKQKPKLAPAQPPRAVSPPMQPNSTLGASALPSSPQSLSLLQQQQQQQAQQLYLQQLSYLAASANLATMDPVTAAAFTRAWNSGALALPASFAAGINTQMPLTMPPSHAVVSLPPSPLLPLHPLSPSAHPLAAAPAATSSSSSGFAAGGFASSSSRKSPAAAGGKKKRAAGAGAGAAAAGGAGWATPSSPPVSTAGLPAPFVFTSPSADSISPPASSAPAPVAASSAAASSAAEPASPTSEGNEYEQLFHFKVTPPDEEILPPRAIQLAASSSSPSNAPSMPPTSDEGQPQPHN